MKLMLTSDGICRAALEQELVKLLEGEPSNAAACILTTASSHKEQSRGAVQTRELFQRLGFARTDFIDIELEAAEKLKDYDVIYLNGGNPFYLLYWLRSSRAVPILRQQAELNRVIIGTSAGAMVLGPSIEHVTELNRIAGYEPMADMLDDDYQAAGLTDITVVPHYNRFADKDAEFETKLQKLEAEKNLVFRRIKDGEAILLDGETDTAVHMRERDCE